MEIEQQQSVVIEQFVNLASSPSSSLASLITEATSHPSLFSFSEILSVPNILQLEGTENSAYYHLLRLFAYGTWRDYTSNACNLPKLVPEQVQKLKQLTVLTLAQSNKVLSYDVLLEEIEVSNVRELEDFLINECMYAGIVKGKLNQSQRCFEVQFAAGRDLIEGQLGSMIESLKKWQVTSENMLLSIQEKIEWATAMSLEDKKHQAEVQDSINKVKYSLNSEGQHVWANDDLFDYGGVINQENYIRSKRRRSPNLSRQNRAENL
ncbi:COP9 signalosome complex subunit 7-like isoform X2 [Mercurialis annua]|uniref:COP9 signalosome complex subunit 7-like isoform X2 n=1 Tax=Mercurialis annua TaxID=3986 RepID=UPI00215E0768|nr:COP9 signalosome complex subunit 7-like isoform X2 [Mercurialis annua]